MQNRSQPEHTSRIKRSAGALLAMTVAGLLGVSVLGGSAEAALPADPALSAYPGTEGFLIKKISYADTKGTQTAILTGAQSQTETGGEVQMNVSIRAYGYDESRGSPRQTFKMRDFVHKCETYARLEFVEAAPIITDLDGDGTHEIWVAYYKGCHGDVSPDELKVLLYRGGQKYALRGETTVFVDNTVYGGSYKADKSFSSIPKVFFDYADELFRRYADDSD